MALQVTAMDRTFTLEKGDGKTLELKDPNPDMSPEEIVKYYSTEHPELTNAMIDGPKVVGNKANYKITTKAGKLG